jgi:polyferredoxin
MKSINSIINIFATIIIFLISSLNTYGEYIHCNSCEKLIIKNNTITNISQLSKEKFQLHDEDEEDFEKFTDYEETNRYLNEEEKQDRQLYRILWILLAVVITGILVRFKSTRQLRFPIMILFLIYLGFFLGGCPCPISSFQNLILAILGVDVAWQSLIWFIGLIPITYFFGKVWCGWICHLGSFQEILYRNKSLKLFKSKKSQNVFKIIRYIFLVLLIMQLIITKTNLFIKIDPFKVAFNFISVYEVGWYLLVLLIISSIFIYRPFCKTICPIGLILGWISYLPGSSIIGTNNVCSKCGNCEKVCKISAISTENNKDIYLDSSECQMCGDCLDQCDMKNLKFARKERFNKTNLLLYHNKKRDS